MKKERPTHRNVKATPQEMAYEGPAEVDFKSGIVIQGMAAWREYRKWRRTLARIKPELRKAFPDDGSVNEALEFVMSLRQAPVLSIRAKKRKTA